MKKVFLFLAPIIFLVIFSSLYLQKNVLAEENFVGQRPSQSIVVDGDEVEYLEKEKKIIATGNVSVRYGDVTLECDRIEVDTENQTALCEGNVRIEQPARGVLTGERIFYDLARKEGSVVMGRVQAYPWYGRAETTERVSEVEYVLKNGYITTCDHENPHYRLRASEVRVFPKDKVIAKNVVMYIGRLPVMWFPVYHQPIIENRPRVQFIYGTSSDWGNFLLSAWRFHLTGKTNVDVLVDYRSRKGFAEGADLYYDMKDFGLEGLGSGLFRSYFVHQNDFGTYSKKAFRDEDDSAKLRKRFQWKHRMDMREDARVILEMNKLSDEHFLKDYFFNEYTTSGRIPRNYISFVHASPNYSLSVEANARLDDFYTVTQKLPQVRMSIPDQRLWDTNFYYSGDHSGTVFDKAYASDQQQNERVSRLDSMNQLSYLTKIGFLQMMPFATFRNTAYTRTAEESEEVNRVSVGGGLNLSSRFHRVFDVQSEFLGIAVNQLRHLISPQIRYTHLHSPTVSSDRLYQLDEVDALTKLNVVELRLENKLQTKRGKAGNQRTVDLVRFISEVDYHFNLKKDNLSMQDGGKFENLKFLLELRPYDWLYLDSGVEITPDNQALRKGFIEAVMRPTDALRLNMSYRYGKEYPSSRNLLTFDADYKINKKWRVGLYERFNLEKSVIEEQQISITRDLHCWELEFVYSVEGSRFFRDEYTIWMALKLKAFPDLQLGLSRSFSKRPPGSLPPGEERTD